MTPGKVTVINAADLEAHGSLRPDPAMLDLQVEIVPIDSVRLFPGNAREGDPQKIADSIDENGFFDPLTVQRSTGYIITGNHTWLGAKQRGMTEIPIIPIDVDDDRARRMNLVHNKLQDDSSYDAKKLIAQLTSLEDLVGTGWDDDELAQLLGGDDEPEEDDEEPLGIDGLGVVILAQNEQHQQQIIDDLTGQGYSAAPTTVKNTVKLSNDF